MKVVLPLVFLISAYCLLAPYSKVEESFNIQAIHDILHHHIHIHQYDHLAFPGVVPRSFLGAIVVAAITKAILFLLPFTPSGITQQLMARLVLGGCVALGMHRFSCAVRTLFGARAAAVFVALTCCQFHIVFWSSRTLPNMFAFPLVLYGLAHWLESHVANSNRITSLKCMVRYLAVAGVVFRFEVGLLLVILCLTEVARELSLFRVLLVQGVATVTASVVLTVLVDSYFWQYWLWPEGVVFYFNVILNKSSAWGTLPFYAYFVSFLPRLLLVSYPLALAALVTDSRVRQMVLPCLIYIGLFSFLPHKEWRFILYTLPILTAAASVWVSQVSVRAVRSRVYATILAAIGLGAMLSLGATILMLVVSIENYPGGHALANLHRLESRDQHVSVHLDVATAMTGASRFGELYKEWTYDKNETLTTPDDYILAGYTHLITSQPDFHNLSSYDTIDTTYGYSRLQLRLDRLKALTWPIEIITEPKLSTLKLKDPQMTRITAMSHREPVLLFSKTYCPYSHHAKRLLHKYCPRGSFAIVEVDLLPDGNEWKSALGRLTGRYTFPNLLIQGTSVGGADNLVWLDNQDQLAPLLPCHTKIRHTP